MSLQSLPPSDIVLDLRGGELAILLLVYWVSEPKAGGFDKNNEVVVLCSKVRIWGLGPVRHVR